MAALQYEFLSGPEKAAILVLALSQDRVRELLSKMGDSEVERILSSVSRFEEIPSTVLDQVLAEFQEAIGHEKLTLAGGRDRALGLIRGTLEETRALRMMDKLGRDEKRVDWTWRPYTPEFIAEAIAEEHPQTIALLLAQLPAERASGVVTALPGAVRADVVLRIASVQDVASDVIHELEDELSVIFEREVGAPTPLGGHEVAAKVLNGVPKSDSQSILDAVDTSDPTTAAQIRKRMLTFNDLSSVDNRGIQSLLREVATEDLVVALKTATEEMKEKIFANVSSRAADQIREEFDLLPAMRLSEIEKIQMEIVEVARRLEEEGTLTIDAGGGGDDALV